MRKKQVTSVLVAIILGFLSVAFIKQDINPIHWQEGERVFVLFLSALYLLFML